MEVPEEHSPQLDSQPVASPAVVICRICLSTRQHMISIHSTVPEYDQKTLYAMLLSVCLPLNERETVPGLPEQICRNCKWKLLSAYDLYETTLASDEQLRAQSGTFDSRKQQGAPSVTVTLDTDGGRQMLLRKGATTLKRPLSNLAADGSDHQPEQHPGKKISLECVKQETPDDECYEMSFGSSKFNYTSEALGEVSGMMDTTEDGDAEDRTNQSFPEEDESKDAAIPDSLDAFFLEHYQVETSSGNHVCGLCKQEFAYKSQCRIHIVQKHNPAKPFKCDVCFCTLTSHHRLVRHQIVSHGVGQMKDEDAIKSPLGSNGEVTYTCPICAKVFNSSVRFKRHKSVHVAYKRPFKCEVCLYRFATKAQLTQHAKVHEPKPPATADSPGLDGSGSGPYECDHCEETFPGKRARTMHLKKVHQVYQVPGGSGLRSDERENSEYVCIICKASFARETVLNTHMKMHELLAAEKDKEKRFDLEKLVKQELQQQMMLKVPPLPPLSPEVVDKSNHVLEPFVLGLVPVAKAGTGSNNNNNNNEDSATSVPSTGPCSAPGGSTGSALPTTGEIPKQKEPPKSDIAYLCTICEKEFDERELLKKHQKEAHPKLNVDIVLPKGGMSGNGGMGSGRMGKPFLPRLTAKPGLNLRLLNGSHKQRHKASEDSSSLEYDHENDGNSTQTGDDEAASGVKSAPLRCELCHKTFSYKCYLAMHMRKNHDKSKPYGCKVCHYRFGYRGTLLRHQLVHSSQNVRPGGHGSIIFKCRICSAKFLELKQLNIHLKTHRKPTDDPNRKVQLIQCHECSQIFSDRAQFRQHMAEEHEQEMGMILDHGESRPSSHHQRSDADVFRPEPRPIVGSSSSMLHARRGSSSPMTDLKLLHESRDEDDESFLDDLSIIKIESNFE
uniref:Uncharacterized protein n=1 Tax=Anopheles atroparvus TaxID=41427 RepID=A0AAG5DHQ2_ANOAO